MSEAVSSKNPSVTEWVLWGALLGSHFLYAGIVALAAPPAHAGPLVVPLSALAVMEGAGALGAYFVLLSDERIRGWLREAQAHGQGREEARLLVLQRLQPFSVMVWAIAESVTLVGLALAFAGQLSFTRFLPFLIGGVAVHLTCLPRGRRVPQIAAELPWPAGA